MILQIYNKIIICLGIQHIYDLLKTLYILSNLAGFYLIILDYWASLDNDVIFLRLSLDSLSFPVFGSHPPRLSLYFPSLFLFPMPLFLLASQCDLSRHNLPASVLRWNPAARAVVFVRTLKLFFFASLRFLILSLLASSMARNEDCLHCSDLQAELEEIRAQQNILDNQQRILEAKIDNQNRIINDKYRAEINLFLHRTSSLHE